MTKYASFLWYNYSDFIYYISFLLNDKEKKERLGGINDNYDR